MAKMAGHRAWRFSSMTRRLCNMLRRQTIHFVMPQFHSSLPHMFCSDIERDFVRTHNHQVRARNIGISRQLSHRLLIMGKPWSTARRVPHGYPAGVCHRAVIAINCANAERTEHPAPV